MKLNCIFENKFTKRNNMLIVINKLLSTPCRLPVLLINRAYYVPNIHRR